MFVTRFREAIVIVVSLVDSPTKFRRTLLLLFAEGQGHATHSKEVSATVVTRAVSATITTAVTPGVETVDTVRPAPKVHALLFREANVTVAVAADLLMICPMVTVMLLLTLVPTADRVVAVAPAMLSSVANVIVVIAAVSAMVMVDSMEVVDMVVVLHAVLLVYALHSSVVNVIVEIAAALLMILTHPTMAVRTALWVCALLSNVASASEAMTAAFLTLLMLLRLLCPQPIKQEIERMPKTMFLL